MSSTANNIWPAIERKDLSALQAALNAGSMTGRRRKLGRGLDGAWLYGNAMAGAARALWPEGVELIKQAKGHTSSSSWLALAQSLNTEDAHAMECADQIAHTLGQPETAHATASLVLYALNWGEGERQAQAMRFLLHHLNPEPAHGQIWGAVFGLALFRDDDISCCRGLIQAGFRPSLMYPQDHDLFYDRAGSYVGSIPQELFAAGLDPHQALHVGAPPWKWEAEKYLSQRQNDLMNGSTPHTQRHTRPERL